MEYNGGVKRNGYVLMVSLVSAGVLMTLALLFFATRSGILRNILPGVGDRQGSTLGIFAQNNQPQTGNLKSTLPTRDPKAPTLTPRPPTPTPTKRATVTIVPTSVVVRIAAAQTPTPTIAAPASIPASGSPSILLLVYGLGIGSGSALLVLSRRV